MGRTIRDARKQRGWSQERLAQEAHVKQQSVSKWESGRARPTVEVLEKLSTLLGVGFHLLMYEAGYLSEVPRELSLLDKVRGADAAAAAGRPVPPMPRDIRDIRNQIAHGIGELNREDLLLVEEYVDELLKDRARK